jgi:hypothetical protein
VGPRATAPAAAVRGVQCRLAMRRLVRRRFLVPALEALILAVPMLAVVSLSAVSSAGCLCDCEGSFNNVNVSIPAGAETLTTMGNGCGAPFCQGSAGSDGGCNYYHVPLVGEGTCHLTARAKDGRQVSTDLTVKQTKTNCCGPIFDYESDGGLTLMYGTSDASTGGDAP